jgi:hypothetical protein
MSYDQRRVPQLWGLPLRGPQGVLVKGFQNSNYRILSSPLQRTVCASGTVLGHRRGRSFPGFGGGGPRTRC